ncbi:exported hypothetical protein [Candidatus Terasakiella magnetica]|nr:exported hypothetical protein [Candidatus Terasakiella magnetica]
MRSLVFGVALILAASGAVAAEKSAALVMDYMGRPAPSLATYSELAAGASFALGPTETVTLLHYRSCRTLNIKGGRVNVGRDRIEAEGGAVTEEPGDTCPKEVAINTSGVSGGVVMRALDFITLPTEIDCVVVGRRLAEVGWIAIADETGGVVERLAVSGSRAMSPLGRPPLFKDRTYQMMILRPNGSLLKQVPVAVEESHRDRLCLVRID